MISLKGEAKEIEPVHYAYSNYLGSGIYRTTGQDVTLLNLPFSVELGQEGQTSYSLRLPVSLGFFDFNFDDIPELELPDKVGTFTFTPGISAHAYSTKNEQLGTEYKDNFVRILPDFNTLMVLTSPLLFSGIA